MMYAATVIDEIRRRLIESAMNPADLRIALNVVREVEAEQGKEQTHDDGSGG